MPNDTCQYNTDIICPDVSSKADMRARFPSVVFRKVVRGGCSGRLTGTAPERVAAWARSMLVVFFFAAASVPGTYPQPVSNSDPTYSALRNIILGSEAVSLANFDLKRDAGKFHFNSGTVFSCSRRPWKPNEIV
jgi:hypothetical protein